MPISDAPASQRGSLQRALRWLIAPHGALILIALLYGAVVLARTVQADPPSFDEAVYLSQVAPDVPPTMFTAPRAWGVPLLLAPVLQISSSIEVARVFAVVLSATLLYLAFLPWLGLFRSQEQYKYVPVLAAGLLASLWHTILYGNMILPNLWLTLAVVSGMGWLFRGLEDERMSWRCFGGVVVAFGVAALIRPTDTLAAAGPLFLSLLVFRRWRRLLPAIALMAGLAVGWLPWLIEAYVTYGGPLRRLRTGASGSPGHLVFSLPNYFESVDGLHLDCTTWKRCEGIDLKAGVWWLLLPLLAGVGLIVASRRDWGRIALTVVGVALSILTPYIFLLNIAQPRYLLPVYAALFIPVSAGLLSAGDLPRAWQRRIAAAVIIVACVAHVIVQQGVFDKVYGVLHRNLDGGAKHAKFLKESVGISEPCLYWGEGAIAGSYPVKCQSHWVKKKAPAENDHQIARARAAGAKVVVRLPIWTETPEFMKSWRRFRLDTWAYYVPAGQEVGPRADEVTERPLHVLSKNSEAVTIRPDGPGRFVVDLPAELDQNKVSLQFPDGATYRRQPLESEYRLQPVARDFEVSFSLELREGSPAEVRVTLYSYPESGDLIKTSTKAAVQPGASPTTIELQPEEGGPFKAFKLRFSIHPSEPRAAKVVVTGPVAQRLQPTSHESVDGDDAGAPASRDGSVPEADAARP